MEQLDDSVGPSARATIELLTSELVTNAVRHGACDPHESILLHAERTDGSIRVEVCDEGSGRPEELRPDPGDMLEPGGNGLVLVETLAERWGVKSGSPNCVWFEAPLAAAA